MTPKPPYAQALVLSDTPERVRLRELQRLLGERRDQIAELDLEIETLREELAVFEVAYRARLAQEHGALKRIEQLVLHLARWAELLRDVPAAHVAAKAARVEARREQELDDNEEERAEVQRLEEAPQRSPSERLKAAYRALARRFHPDLARTEKERLEFGEIMTRINALYKAGDLERLEKMAEQAKGAELDALDLSIAEQLAVLEERLRAFNQALANLRDERAALERSSTCELMRNVAQANAAGGDLLAEVQAELRGRVQKAYAQIRTAAHELEIEVSRFNRDNAQGLEIKERNKELARRFDPFSDKRIVRLGLEELRDLRAKPEAKRLAERLESEAPSLLRVLFLTYVAELSPFPLPGLESYADVSLRFEHLGQNEHESLEQALVRADSLVEFGVKRSSDKVVHTGLRFRSEIAREAVPVLLKSLSVRREFKRVLSVLGERETCPSCDKSVFLVPLFRTHGIDDLRALVCPRCAHTLRSYWMPKGKDVQAVLNDAFLDFEIITEWSFQLARGNLAAQLLPMQEEDMTVGDLKQRIYDDLFKRYTLDIEVKQLQLFQKGKPVKDAKALSEVRDRRFVIRFTKDAGLKEAQALETLRHRVRNRFRA